MRDLLCVKQDEASIVVVTAIELMATVPAAGREKDGRITA